MIPGVDQVDVANYLQPSHVYDSGVAVRADVLLPAWKRWGWTHLGGAGARHLRLEY